MTRAVIHTSCGKYILYALNFMVSIGGAALLGIGIWRLLDETRLNLERYVVEPNSDVSKFMASYVQIFLMLLGAVTHVSFAMYGVCGVIIKSRMMLAGYLCLLTVVMTGYVVVGVLGVRALADNIHPTLHNNLYNKFTERKSFGWNVIQKQYSCCGVDSVHDFNTTKWSEDTGKLFPISCCIKPKNPKPKFSEVCAAGKLTTVAFRSGCYRQISRWYVEFCFVLIGCGFACAGIQLITYIAAIMMCFSKRARSYDINR
ncbi:unnamed protein product [Owenia fusiformis]|uniref:Tetraspanin n=1 Tax=Owenia fusiformis TaxID=6347 RepID=A0A8J1Y0N3_OWEFU|nr:unnamed protein product [Owenia fusiformis]